MSTDPFNELRTFLRIAFWCQVGALITVVMAVTTVTFILWPDRSTPTFPAEGPTRQSHQADNFWSPPDTTRIMELPNGALIDYGRELIAHTARYIGPKGSVIQITNGMNCSNCHLKAGKKIFGNNYATTASNYPKFRARSGTIENLERRVNDCIERSLNGKPLPVSSHEMKAIVAYIKWVGQNTPHDARVNGAGLIQLQLLERAADPVAGNLLFQQHCARCHGPEGKGVLWADSVEWRYPPLQGEHSYNIGAGLYRISKLASYVYANMPYGVTHDHPQLQVAEAWDVAAYICSLPRPDKDLSQDWPDLSSKPYDHPFGPYADSFPEVQHKYGPFQPIILAAKKKSSP